MASVLHIIYLQITLERHQGERNIVNRRMGDVAAPIRLEIQRV